MSQDVIRFEPNTPVEVALRFPTGKIVEGRFGRQVMFSVEGGKTMYLDLGPAQMVSDLGVKPGETFFVCKKWTGRKADAPVWDAWLSPTTEKFRAAREMTAPQPGDTPAQRRMREDLARSLELAAQHGTSSSRAKALAEERAATTVPPRQALPASKFGPPPAVVHGAAAPASNLRPMPAASKTPPVKQQFGDAFEYFLVEAGRAVHHAERVLAEEGASIRFDSRDIAAVATSMFIAADKHDYLLWTPPAKPYSEAAAGGAQ